MPDKKISALPAFTGDIAPADLFVIVDTSDGVTKKIAFSDMVFPYMVYRGTDGRRWKFTIDSTGMPSLPGEDLGV